MPSNSQRWSEKTVLSTTLSACLALSSSALAQPAPSSKPAPASPPTSQKTSTTEPPAAVPTSQDPRQQTLLRMERRLSFTIENKRLEEVFAYLRQVTHAEIEPLWTTDQQQGLDKDALVALTIVNQPALNVLEKVLTKVTTGSDLGGNTWQLSPDGMLQCGPKELLNHTRRLEIYDINDLLLVIPNHPDAVNIDLSSVLQQSQGGGGTNPLGNTNNQQPLTPEQQAKAREDRIKAIVDLIQSTVESEQWADNGGTGGTIRAFNGTLLINASDYIHRQLNGYPYWPQGYETRTINHKRVVSLNMAEPEAKTKAQRYTPPAQP